MEFDHIVNFECFINPVRMVRQVDKIDPTLFDLHCKVLISIGRFRAFFLDKERKLAYLLKNVY